MYQAQWANGVGDAGQVGAVYSQIHILRKTCSQGIARLYMKEDGQSTDYAVIDSGLPQRIAHACGRCS